MTLPSEIVADFVVSQTDVLLGKLKTFFDFPARASHLHERLEGCVEWGKSEVVSQLSIGHTGSDQRSRTGIFKGCPTRQGYEPPIINAFPFGTRTAAQTLPVGGRGTGRLRFNGVLFNAPPDFM